MILSNIYNIVTVVYIIVKLAQNLGLLSCPNIAVKNVTFSHFLIDSNSLQFK
jgi:hypothetical protein